MTEPRNLRIRGDLMIAENVRAAIARNNVQRGRVAEAVGLTREQFSRRCNGETPFEASVVLMVADALDIPASDLFVTDGTGVVALSP